MPSPDPRAGGCLIAVCLLIGFADGMSGRNPLQGVLIGLGVGIVLAVVVWLVDRRRSDDSTP